MHRFGRWLALLVIAAALAVVPAAPARAACHEFRFDRDAYAVSESAGSVTVTVSRDNGFAPSSIRYETVDGTARAGQDYSARSGTLQYSNQISMSFTVPITGDAADEPNETFQVRLSDPAGCAPNPNFDVDDPSTVTIQDDDAPPPPPPPSPSPTTPATPAEVTTTPSPSAATPTTTPPRTPSATPTTASPTTEPGTVEAAASPAADSGGPGGRGLATVLALLLALGVGGAILARRRSTA